MDTIVKETKAKEYSSKARELAEKFKEQKVTESKERVELLCKLLLEKLEKNEGIWNQRFDTVIVRFHEDQVYIFNDDTKLLNEKLKEIGFLFLGNERYTEEWSYCGERSMELKVL